MTDRDKAKLLGIHPSLIERVGRILDAMAALGHPMCVTDGVRTTAQQAALYAKGRTAPGAIVTYADGVTKTSNHQPKADGYGYAVDCAFLVNGKPSWDVSLPWAAYGALAQAVGLTWGGAWAKKLHDYPHIELT